MNYSVDTVSKGTHELEGRIRQAAPGVRSVSEDAHREHQGPRPALRDARRILASDREQQRRSLAWIREQSLLPECVESIANHDLDIKPHVIELL